MFSGYKAMKRAERKAKIVRFLDLCLYSLALFGIGFWVALMINSPII